MNTHKLFQLGILQSGALALAAAAALAASLTLDLFSVQTAFAADTGSDAYEQAKPRTVVPYNPMDFDKFVGYYQLAPEIFFHITRDGSHYFAQLTGQQPLEIYPDSAGEFFSKLVPAQITFDQKADGKITGLVLHQGGRSQTAKRVAPAVAERVQAALTARIQSNKPSPGTEAAVRHQLESMVKGEADYSAMSPELAAAAHQQADRASQAFSQLGALESLTFKGVSPQGLDVYDATFAQGQLEIVIAPLGPDGKIQTLFMHPPQP